jgi:3-dehydroquinate synthetase
VARLLALLGLPASLAELRARYRQTLAPAALLAGMRHDKKGAAGEPRFVLVLRAGRIEHGVALEPALLDLLLA